MTLIIEGLPAGMVLKADAIDRQLARRQLGHGRGGRMKIERDRVRILSGLRHGLTLGSPLTLHVPNLDHENWSAAMSPAPVKPGEGGVRVSVPRPGHADLAGALKYGFDDIRNVLERASARETVNRVLAGAVARELLAQFGIELASHVLGIGSARVKDPRALREGLELRRLQELADDDPVRCLDPDASAAMRAQVDAAREGGDTLGGLVEVLARGLSAGLGSHVHWDRRLDARLAAALMSVPAVKGVEIGPAFENCALPGSKVMDEILPADQPPGRRDTRGLAVTLRRTGNRAGGIEGGISNGQELVLRAAMKPLPTLMKPLRSVDLESGEPVSAHRERSDTCAVPACAVICEAAAAWELCAAWLEVWGADHMEEIHRRVSGAAGVAETARGPSGEGKPS